MYGAQLIEALRRTLRIGQPGAAVLTQSEPNIEFFGVGGEKMRATVSVADGALYIRTFRHLWCIGDKQ